MSHIPVFLEEVISNLNINPNGTYLDLTLGSGGHSKEILKKLSDNGLLICFDKDIEAIERTIPYLKKISNNFKLVNSDFKNLKSELDKLKIDHVDGLLIDLGVSSPQLDQAERGFSYNKDSYLDMRMDKSQKLDAHYIVNNYTKEQLNLMLKNNAEVKQYLQISNAIINNRPIETTMQLVDIIKNSLPSFILRKKNPAKAVFQALRVEVNNEIESLKSVLNQSIKLMKNNSKLLIITFNSLEDRIVKNFFGSLTRSLIDPKMAYQEEKKWSTKSIKISKKEMEQNRRSRSAKLRILVKIGEQ